jgi:hypothetical protein
VSEIDELKALVAQQQKRIERLELALVVLHLTEKFTVVPPAEETRAAGWLQDGRHVWLQPMRDKEGIHFLRIESSKKGPDDGGS